MYNAAPIIKKPAHEMPAPGYTDFVNIYITENCTPIEQEVLIKHEQAHIWLCHNTRYKEMINNLQDSFSAENWNLACDLEIARNIYNESDIDVIKRPFSILKSGIVPDSVPDLPDELLYCEEIYEWLKANPQDTPQQQMCGTKSDNELPDETEDLQGDITIENVAQAVDEIKQELANAQARSEAAEKTALALDELKSRKPSLASEIDAQLRVRAERVRCYRRPSRRNPSFDENFLPKGRATFAKSPHVEVFVDRSGSFCPQKTAIAESKVKTILDRYGLSIQHDVWYFGDNKLSSKDFQGGNTPYHLILEHINNTVPKVAIVITDDDFCKELAPPPKVTQMLVIPVGCDHTSFAQKANATEVT